MLCEVLRCGSRVPEGGRKLVTPGPPALGEAELGRGPKSHSTLDPVPGLGGSLF